MYTHAHGINLLVHLYVCVCMYVHTFVCMYVCMHVVCTYPRTCVVCDCVCVCVGVYVFNVYIEVYCPSKA